MMMMGGNNNQVCAQNEGGGEGGVILKKGPWTAAEDVILAEYVRTHGEGNWNAVQINTGLARCGKSCRLRWANHLRPNLKKGAFSPEEERIIIELHAKMGNKWARMATQLPGRTDNEIKNYWNTRIKKRQRQGLPLYPPDIQPLHSQHQQTRHRSLLATPIVSPTGTSMSSTHVSPLHSPHKPSFSTLPLFDSSTSNTCNNINANNGNNNNNNNTISSDFFFTREAPSLQVPMRYKRFRHHVSESYNNVVVNGGSGNDSTGWSFMLPYPPLQKNSFFNPHNVGTSTTLTSPHYSFPSYSFDPIALNVTSSSSILTDQHCFDTGQFISTPEFFYPSKSNNELPSNQIMSLEGNSEVTFHTKGNSSYISGGDLLDDMLEEAQLLAAGHDDDIMRRQSCMAGFSTGSDGLASAKEETVTDQEINATQEDYSRLLDLPSSTEMPDWYDDCGKSPTGH